MTGYAAYMTAVAEYLTVVSQVPGSPDATEALDRAEFYLLAVTDYITLAAERDLVVAFAGAIDTLRSRHEEALSLFQKE